MSDPNRERASILKPYQIFPAYEVVQAIQEDLPPEQEIQKRNIVMLSGPPGSGKSHMARWLQTKFGNKSRILRPGSELYRMMRLAGLPETHIDYADFKQLPYGRERMFAASQLFRNIDPDIFTRQMANSADWRDSNTIIMDNAGYIEEVEFAVRHSKKRVMIELMCPWYLMGKVGSSGPMIAYHNAFANASLWPDDVRCALLMSPDIPLQKTEGMAFSFSVYAKESLKANVFTSVFSSRNEMTTRNTLRSMWLECLESALPLAQGELPLTSPAK